MPYAASAPAYRPLGAINMTPLIDVLLVLLVMLVITVPVLTHSLDIPLPTGPGKLEIRDENTVSIDAQDRLYWNGQELERGELLNQLAASARLTEEPTLRFEPHPLASYDGSARTIALIKNAGVTNFAFVGNERYRDFDRAAD